MPAEVDADVAEAAHADPAAIAVTMADLLRRQGVPVPVGRVVTYTEALGAVGLDRRQQVYWAGRSTLLRRAEDIPAYDRAFGALFLQREPMLPPVVEQQRVLAFDAELTDDPLDDEGPHEHGDGDGDLEAVRWSSTEVLRHKDFASYSPGEFDEARRLMADLRLAGATRRSRRRAPHARRRGARPDLRRTVRRALAADGEPIVRAFSDPSERPRRLVLLCDVSGSMESYTRALLRFLHAAKISRRHVEAFTIGTRVTRITRELSSHDPDAALAAAGRAVADWSGGTRLGDGLRTFNDRWGVRGLARGAIVVVLSDGWDRGDPERLAAEMERLARVAHRIVWVNPLKASEGYAPIARGMAAALPHVDEFIEGHSLAALETLAEVINRP